MVDNFEVLRFLSDHVFSLLQTRARLTVCVTSMNVGILEEEPRIVSDQVGVNETNFGIKLFCFVLGETFWLINYLFCLLAIENVRK